MMRDRKHARATDAKKKFERAHRLIKNINSFDVTGSCEIKI